MKIDIMNINTIIEVNKLPQVSNPVYMEDDLIPTRDGIFSYDIFGKPSSTKRKFQFAYIDLKRKFLHPVFYILITRTYRMINDIINGSKFVTLKNGIIVESEDGETGLDFLYNNWEKIKWPTEGNLSRKEKIDILKKFSKDEIFCDKWLVCPPFYRDLQSRVGEASQSTDEVSPLYSKLIAYTNNISLTNDIFTGKITEFNVQTTLIDLYNLLTAKIKGKQGIIHKNLMGKSTDYSVRAVISAPKICTNNYKDQQIPYGHIGIPLHLTINLFLPFVLHELERYLSDFKENKIVFSSFEGKEIVNQTVDKLESKTLVKMINLFARSHENRLMPFVITDKEGKVPISVHNFETAMKRKFTLTDILFLATYNATRNKYVLATRYPLEDYRNIAPHAIKIITTYETIMLPSLTEPGVHLNYPVLRGDKTFWIDSVVVNNSYLAGWGSGDFDGDMVSIKGLYSQEANLEIENIIKSKMSLVNTSGEPSRTITQKEPLIALYELTR